jgi:vesicle coat complex subunit
VEYTSVSYEFRTRVNAANALKRIDYFDETMMKNLVHTLYNANSRLASPCGDVLKSYFEKAKYKKQIQGYLYSQKWEEWQWERISKVVQ